MSTILSLRDLALKAAELRAEGKRLVLCHGVFDLLHIGHIRYLQRAKELGDVLLVTVTQDRYVDKGPDRPAFTEQLRVAALASLSCVDFVAVNEWPTAEETLRLLRPHIYAKGAEYKGLDDASGNMAKEAAVVEETGGRLEFIQDIVFSSSNLINRYLSAFPEHSREYLRLFRQRHSLEEMEAHLRALRDLTVLLVGDAIIDEYSYCSALGASSKDPVLALLHQSDDLFVGGGAAVARHLAQHVKKVLWCTVIGSDDQANFFRHTLADNIECYPVIRSGAPTVRKTRFVDGYSFQKLFEIYHMADPSLPEETEAALEDLVFGHMPAVDLVMAADFGNGCVTLPLAARLSREAPWLAVNTQANAGNRGQHTISRYPKAHFVSLARHEMNLEFRNRSLSSIDMMLELKKRMGARCVLLTEGRDGCSVQDDHDLSRAPSFSAQVVDRVGAGDALFSLTSLLAYKKVPADVLAFLGNVAGSLAVSHIGNAKSVSQEAMLQYIRAILK